MHFCDLYVVLSYVQWFFGFNKQFTVPVKRPWIYILPFTFLLRILPALEATFMVKCANDQGLRFGEKIAQAIANKIINTLDIQFLRKSLLYAINNSQLSSTLFGFFKQSVCFIKQAGTLECNAHTIH